MGERRATGVQHNGEMKFTPLRLLAFGAVTAAAVTSSASASNAPANELDNVLVIAKSSNRNEVHYAMHVDDACAPIAPAPISAYWRMLERGPDVTEPLRGREESVLGVERQVVEAGAVRAALRAFPGRTLVFRTWRDKGGKCASAVEMMVAGVPAQLAGVYVQQKLFGVAYVELTARTANGVVVRERLVP
jgi:hypothetical protein